MEGEFHGRHEFCTAAVGLKGRIDGSRAVRTGVCGCWAVFEVVMREWRLDRGAFLDGVFLFDESFEKFALMTDCEFDQSLRCCRLNLSVWIECRN